MQLGANCALVLLQNLAHRGAAEIATLDVEQYRDFPRSKFATAHVSLEEFLHKEIELSQDTIAVTKFGHAIAVRPRRML
jgi:hypothetical protein